MASLHQLRGTEAMANQLLPGSAAYKKMPGFRSVEDNRPDGFTVPANGLPARFNVQGGHGRVSTGKYYQLLSVAVELLGEIAETEAVWRHVLDLGSGTETAVGNVYRGAIESNSWVLPIWSKWAWLDTQTIGRPLRSGTCAR